MKNSKSVSEHVRPMLAAMARSIDAARARRTASRNNSGTGSSEGTASSNTKFTVGNPNADNGKSKACQRSPQSSFFRDRGTYRKTG
jgi:hypothetical protein